MTTTEDINKAVKEIEERWQGKFIDSQAFADLKALLFSTKALLSSADVDRDVIQRQAAEIEDYENHLKFVQTYSTLLMEKQHEYIKGVEAERDRYLKALEWIGADGCPAEGKDGGCRVIGKCAECMKQKAREAHGRE